MKLLSKYFLIITLLLSCKPSQQVAVPATVNVASKNYRITKDSRIDTTLDNFLKPYRDKMKGEMDVVIGFSTKTLYKARPESVLGNFMTDAMLTMAKEKFNRNVDAAFLNYGGIRNSLSQGDVTVGNVFELMPFDNLIVLQEVKGSALKEFADLTARSGGWPCSGISYQIKDKAAVNILINGEPLDINKIYTIANNDYVANGGDDAQMLKVIKQINMGYLYRDALIEYIKRLTKQGKPVDGKIEKRVTNAN